MAEKSTNNQGVKSKRESFRERLASRYPDLDMNDEDAVYNQLSTDYDHYDQNKQKMDGFNQMLQEYPQAPGLVTGMLTKRTRMAATLALLVI